MRVQLNLASHPFVELGPLYLRLRVLIILLALVAVPLWLLLGSEKRQAALAHARLAGVQQNIQAMQNQQVQFQSQMREPKNAAILSQSQFLNELFTRKSFSWTAVMMDLENVLPSGVQVLNIDPVIARDGKVTIRLRVSGQHERAVDLIRNLEHSHRFLYPRLADETAETNQNGQAIQPVSAVQNVNFDLLAEYNPLPDTAGKTVPGKKADSPARHPRSPIGRGKSRTAASGPAAKVATGGPAQ